VENVTDRIRNPFGMDPPCERFVSGYGDVNAHFHVVGDHPGVHGGAETGVPFTNGAGLRLQAALAEAGLLASTGDRPGVDRTFLSYLHGCVVDGEPTAASYTEMERYFDAELRAIAAHVLLPVGERATRHVLRSYTARDPETGLEALYGTELRGGGWLVLPVREPADWRDGDPDRLVAALAELRRTDYRRESDLGRFLAGEESYFVR
jgi:uracil-DNA glycosylase